MMHPQSTTLQHISWRCVSMSPSNLFPLLSSYLEHASYASQVICSMFPVSQAISSMRPASLKWYPACFLRLSSDLQHVSCVSQAIFSMLKQSTIRFALLTHSICEESIILDCITQHYTVRSSAHEMWCRSAVEPHCCVPGWHRAVPLVVQYQGLDKTWASVFKTGICQIREVAGYVKQMGEKMATEAEAFIRVNFCVLS